MRDMQASLEKLRTDAAEAALIRDLATDRRKRELFTKLADHFATLAAEVERAISTHETEQRAASTDGPFILNVGSWHFSNTPRSPTFCPLTGRADIPPQGRDFRLKQTSAPAWQVGKVSKRGQRVPTGCDLLAAETSQGRPLGASPDGPTRGRVWRGR